MFGPSFLEFGNSGDLSLVNKDLKGSDGSLKALASLDQVPNTQPNPDLVKDLRVQRHSIMKGETAFLWCIQDGESTESRQLIPSWVSRPLELALLKFSEDNGKWNKLLAERDGNLTANQSKRYQEFREHNKEIRFLFSKEEKCQIRKVRNQQDLHKMNEKMFSLQVSLDAENGSLSIRAGKGMPRQLVLLRSEPCEVDQLPQEFNHGVSNEVAEAFEWGLLDDGQPQPELEAEQLAEIEAKQAIDAGAPEEEEEVWGANTSEEELFEEAGVSKAAARVKDFFHRSSFQALETKGLVLVPNHVHGVFLSYHKSTRCWQGFYPGRRSGLGYCWGGSTGRALALHVERILS